MIVLLIKSWTSPARNFSNRFYASYCLCSQPVWCHQWSNSDISCICLWRISWKRCNPLGSSSFRHEQAYSAWIHSLKSWWGVMHSVWGCIVHAGIYKWGMDSRSRRPATDNYAESKSCAAEFASRKRGPNSMDRFDLHQQVRYRGEKETGATNVYHIQKSQESNCLVK